MDNHQEKEFQIKKLHEHKVSLMIRRAMLSSYQFDPHHIGEI